MPSFTIDGKKIEARPGETVWSAAHRAGIVIPHLCASPNLKAYGSCRLCVCEVEGQKGLPASCTTPAREGMSVRTDSETLNRHRRNIVELYLSEQPENALDASEQLRTYAARFGLRKVRYKSVKRRQYPVDASNPYFAFDANKCIACARCVRACDEMQGTFAISMEGRGYASSVVAGNGVGFAASNCVSCGACVKECPTDALFEKAVAEYGKPEYVARTTCAYCGVGCNFDVGVRAGRIVTMKPVDASPVNWGHACVKGRFGWDYVYSKDRLRKPLKRVGTEWVPIEWDEALRMVAENFMRIRAKDGPDALAGISSSRGTNEENYLMQKFMRCAVGTNNIDNCARVCHSATVSGMMEVFGTWAATNSLADLEQAKLLMLIGSNPTEGHPVTGARIKRAVRKGMKLIVIDPRKIELTRYAAVHLQLKPGTNVALFNALANAILAEGLENKDYIQAHTENFGAWLEAVKKYTPEAAEAITGVPAEKIRQAARLYATSGASMCAHGLGVSEHKYGSYGIMGMCNLAILTGNVSRPGTGINPLRGQNNVQGSCDVGSMPVYFSSYQKLDDPAVQAKFLNITGRPIPARKGWKIPEMWDAVLEGKLRGLWVLGYDVAQTDPNLHKVHAALSKLDFLVVSDLFFNETCKFAHLALPGASFVEKDGTFTNGERRIQRVHKIIDPPDGIVPDLDQIARVAKHMGYDMGDIAADKVMAEIASLTPPMNGVSYDRLETNFGLQWPVPNAASNGTPIMHLQGFPRGKAHFAPVEYLPPGEVPTADYPFTLVTGRVLHHYNSGAQTRHSKLVEFVNQDVLELHAEDAAELGLRDGAPVKITSARGAVTLNCRISERVPPGQVFTTFHFPEVEVNMLLSSSADALSKCPEYKVLTVRLEPVHATKKKSAANGKAIKARVIA
ncbi:MAG: formate dehydrogenase subunit alpha [Planctomycetes bacterium]|nr:formate dehydrogenase subunit alpha [Planctomycetota bacterium]